ncbi:MAG: electron transfer flavoprotein subunit alpha/FixB family protein [Balneolaceae bacterium]|nr:MAG: electron transfer flavoprotein subunit alpha/FixB family protein [Balneolaceae bacterium]
MSLILTYIATSDGKIKRSSLEVLSHCREEAKKNGHTLAAVVLDTDPDSFTGTLEKYGASAIYTVKNPIFKNHLNTPVIEALAAVIDKVKPAVVAFASTEAVKDVMGALATRFDAPAVPDVASFKVTGDGLDALRPVMASKILAKTSGKGDMVFVSVRSGSYDATESPVSAELTSVPFDFDEGGLKNILKEVIKASGDKVDLNEARVVVAAGRGVKDDEGKKLVEELAALFNGAIGASRSVVETGMFDPSTQIGQTGKVVSPELYFAIGISGAIQHVAGMVNSKVIVAINKDEDAPIFQYSTYGLVGDLYKILPPLIEKLREARANA